MTTRFRAFLQLASVCLPLAYGCGHVASDAASVASGGHAGQGASVAAAGDTGEAGGGAVDGLAGSLADGGAAGDVTSDGGSGDSPSDSAGGTTTGGAASSGGHTSLAGSTSSGGSAQAGADTGGTPGNGVGGCDTVLSGSVSAQSDKDLAKLSRVTQITGSLALGGSITSLAPLSCLTSVGGDLSVTGTGLASFASDGLHQVGGHVAFVSNSALTSIQLDGLTSFGIGGADFTVDNAPNLSRVSLTSLTETAPVAGIAITNSGSAAASSLALGFPALKIIRGQLLLRGIANLTNLTGLSALRTVGGALTISGDPALADMTALGALVEADGALAFANDAALAIIDLHSLSKTIATVTQPLLIDQLPSLTNVNLQSLGNLNVAGLTVTNSGSAAKPLTLNLVSLSLVHGPLTLSALPGLKDVAGLPNLRTVNGRIAITSNDNLTSLSGLSNLTQVDGDIDVESDAALATIDLHSLTTVGSGPEALTKTTLAGAHVSSCASCSLMFQSLPKLTALDVRSVTQAASLVIDTTGATATQPLALDFSALTTVKTLFDLSFVPNLANVDGFAKLTQASLFVTDDTALENLDGFGKLVSTSTFIVENDTKLTRIALPALANISSNVVFDALPRVSSISIPHASNSTQDHGGGSLRILNVGRAASGPLTFDVSSLYYLSTLSFVGNPSPVSLGGSVSANARRVLKDLTRIPRRVSVIQWPPKRHPRRKLARLR